jgi:hypothetical protein
MSQRLTPRKQSRLKQQRFNDRYRGNWSSIAKRTRRLVFDRCILNPFHRAAAVHHLRYRDWRGTIAGREIPGWDVVPLCRNCHGIVHRKTLWYSAPINPKTNNRQRWRALWRLRLRFWGWWLFLRGGWAVLVLLLIGLVVWLRSS